MYGSLSQDCLHECNSGDYVCVVVWKSLLRVVRCICLLSGMFEHERRTCLKKSIYYVVVY